MARSIIINIVTNSACSGGISTCHRLRCEGKSDDVVWTSCSLFRRESGECTPGAFRGEDTRERHPLVPGRPYGYLPPRVYNRILGRDRLPSPPVSTDTIIIFDASSDLAFLPDPATRLALRGDRCEEVHRVQHEDVAGLGDRRLLLLPYIDELEGADYASKLRLVKTISKLNCSIALQSSATSSVNHTSTTSSGCSVCPP